jgi:mevalonate kinase
MTTSSAPGKIILFGEHAVVYGRPALAVPVTQVQATATVSATSRTGIWIEAPDIGLASELSRLVPDHPLAAVINRVFSALPSPSSPSRSTPAGLPKGEGCTITITSTIPVASGLGSGAAVSVAIIRALSAFLGQLLPDERVSDLAYEVEKLHHGTPSGIDNTVVTYAKPIYFIRRPSHPGRGAGARAEQSRSGEVETFRVGAPFTIVIGDTGLSVPTKESVSDVRTLWEADQPRWEKVFNDVGDIVQKARRAIETGNIPALGPLMDENHKLLQGMTISCAELDQLVEAARRFGALGAKLSGGGRGGNMIALVRPDKAEPVAVALMTAGAKRTLITTVKQTSEVA